MIDPKLTPGVAKMLGLDKPKKGERPSREDMQHSRGVLETLQRMTRVFQSLTMCQQGLVEAQEKGIPADEYLRSVVNALPDDERQELLSTMPRRFRRALGLDGL